MNNNIIYSILLIFLICLIPISNYIDNRKNNTIKKKLLTKMNIVLVFSIIILIFLQNRLLGIVFALLYFSLLSFN